MKNPITCSTGLLYKFIDDSDKDYFNKIFELLKNYDFDGFELALQKCKRLDNFNLSNDNLKFLQKLKFNTLHAPCDFVFRGDKESERLLKKMKEIYDLIGAKNIVFHTCCFEKDYSILKNHGFDYSIENEDSSRESFKTIKEAKDFLSLNNDFNFTFDFAHGYSIYKNNSLDFIKELNPKIVQVHFAKIK